LSRVSGLVPVRWWLFPFYILRDGYNAKVGEGEEITDEGVEETFEVVAELHC
jgi:hypothetical protein